MIIIKRLDELEMGGRIETTKAQVRWEPCDVVAYVQHCNLIVS